MFEGRDRYSHKIKQSLLTSLLGIVFIVELLYRVQQWLVDHLPDVSREREVEVVELRPETAGLHVFQHTCGVELPGQPRHLLWGMKDRFKDRFVPLSYIHNRSLRQKIYITCTYNYIVAMI